jgi:hypothetical protein
VNKFSTTDINLKQTVWNYLSHVQINYYISCLLKWIYFSEKCPQISPCVLTLEDVMVLRSQKYLANYRVRLTTCSISLGIKYGEKIKISVKINNVVIYLRAKNLNA